MKWVSDLVFFFFFFFFLACLFYLFCVSQVGRVQLEFSAVGNTHMNETQVKYSITRVVTID
jgi:hypothetical protein